MFKVTLAIVSLLNQADARADEWTTTENVITYSWYSQWSSAWRSKIEDDYVAKSEYDTDEMKYGAINWMKFCKDSIDYKLEWKYQNMCDYSAFSTKHCVGDCSAYFFDEDCNEFPVLDDGECINNMALFASKYQGYASSELGIQAIELNTTKGTGDMLHEYQNSSSSSYYQISYTKSYFKNAYTEWKVPMTNSTTTSAGKTVCLTALEPAVYIIGGAIIGIINYNVSYNADTPMYSSDECEKYRNPEIVTNSGGSAGGITGAILGICCLGGIGLAVWFFFIRRTGSAGSLNEDNQKPSTPEAPQQTTTTTIIQQQPAMMMAAPAQPMMMQQQPMMMQQQPMMMQQQPMMMQQPGMVPMQQPGMMMQQPGMMPMQQPGMMPMQPAGMMQPGMQQQVVYQ